MNKKPLLLIAFSLALLSCGGKEDFTPYFDSLEEAGGTMAKEDRLGLDTNNLNLSFSLKNKEGKDLTVSTTPISFSARFSGTSSDKAKDTKTLFTMPKANASLNTITLKGSLLEGNKIISVAAANGLKISTNFCLQNGYAYLDLSNASTLRTAIFNLLKEADVGLDKLPAKSKFTLGEKTLNEVDKYLPLSQYGDDSISSLVSSLKQTYEASPSSFSFLSGSEKTISFKTSSKDDIRKILLSFDKESKYEGDLDRILGYASTLSLDSSITFGQSSLKSASFSFKAGGFDEEGITRDYPDLNYIPTGEIKVGGRFDFLSGQGADFDSTIEDSDFTPIETDIFANLADKIEENKTA